MLNIRVFGARNVTLQTPERPGKWDMLAGATRMGLTGKALGIGTRAAMNNPRLAARALSLATRGTTRYPWERGLQMPEMHLPAMSFSWPWQRRQQFELPIITARQKRVWRPDAWQLLAAFAAGAALMYLLDPDLGNRRRKMTMQRTAGLTRQAFRGLGRAGRKVTTDMAGRREALLHAGHNTGEPLDDATLAHKVESILFRDPDVPKGSINVNAEHGVVVLRGEVRTPDDIRDIERRVSHIEGVNEVRNLLHLVNTPAPMSS